MCLHYGGIQGGEVQSGYGDVIVASLWLNDSGSFVHVCRLWFYHRHDEFVVLGLRGRKGGGGGREGGGGKEEGEGEREEVY